VKAANFDYVHASTLPEVCALLQEHGSGAKLIAGGQSLVPMLAMRLTKPALLIDVNDVQEIKGVAVARDHIEIGCGTRQYQIEASSDIGARLPIIRRALHWVGHPQTRNRGTLGGSLVHADPSAELPLVALLLDAQIVVAQENEDEEALPAEDFFLAPMVTSLLPEQCVIKVVFPLWQGRVGSSFHEVAPRRGDFAMVSAAAQIALDAHGLCLKAAVALGGVAATPIRVKAVEAALLEAKEIPSTLLRELALLAVDEIDPDGDLQASPAYRREVAYVLIERALSDALSEARSVSGVPS
jgi:CO/xanthine dehydrogenase FAD-binding subunit